ncbi:hypothetical protein cyc_00477 [Cyclospora cayetanensis]|uniref:Uncharacterized protein n=1 Tax=Cyclospora cayetanensis TaxID=88456 RepID=A0A1D3CUX0_9EIME|nr:hypothetical protein cyc_00477 [Cyclospora cayetanensis]
MVRVLSFTSVAVVSLLGIGRARAQATGAENTANCLSAINLGRTAKLDVRPSTLVMDTSLAQLAKSVINSGDLVVSDSNCVLHDGLKPTDMKGIVLEGTSKTPPTADEYKAIIQGVITNGLAALGSSYSADTMFDSNVYATFAAQNLAYLMLADAQKVGASSFAALNARQAAGVNISTLPDTAIDTPLSGSSGNGMTSYPATALLVLSLLGFLSA